MMIGCVMTVWVMIRYVINIQYSSLICCLHKTLAISNHTNIYELVRTWTDDGCRSRVSFMYELVIEGRIQGVK